MRREKLKYLSFFLLGLSLGIIVVSTLYEFNQTKQVVNGYTEEDVLQKANELLIKKLRETSDNKGVVNVDNSLNVHNQIKGNKIDDNNKVYEKEDENSDKEFITFEIKKGESSDSIVTRLHEAGIIDDIDKFGKILKDKKLERRLMFGKFKISKDEDIDELLKKLTSD